MSPPYETHLERSRETPDGIDEFNNLFMHRFMTSLLRGLCIKSLLGLCAT